MSIRYLGCMSRSLSNFDRSLNDVSGGPLVYEIWNPLGDPIDTSYSHKVISYLNVIHYCLLLRYAGFSCIQNCIVSYNYLDENRVLWCRLSSEFHIVVLEHYHWPLFRQSYPQLRQKTDTIALLSKSCKLLIVQCKHIVKLQSVSSQKHSLCWLNCLISVSDLRQPANSGGYRTSV